MRITQSELENLRGYVAYLTDRKNKEPISEKLQMEEAAVKEQIKELETEIQEYHEIWGRRIPIPELTSFQDIPKALIRARLSLGINQKELAEMLDLKEQQIQRYEANDYQTASLARILEILKVLKLKVANLEQVSTVPITLGAFYSRLEGIGFDKSLLLNRLLPSSIVSELAKRRSSDSIDDLGIQAAAQIGRVYGWSPEQLLRPGPPQVELQIPGNARFKVRKGANQKRLGAYTIYAHYLALLILQSTSHLPTKRLPTDPYELHKEIVDENSKVTIETALTYLWKMGIPVLPLEDQGAFQGAHFKEDERSIIILKQKTTSEDKWLFDLFHECWHTIEKQDQKTGGVFELEELEHISTRPSKEETIASQFASAVLIGHNPNKLIHQSLSESRNELSYLKNAVKNVAERENVSMGVLANSLAFRLSQEGIDWWGPASRLQVINPRIHHIARDILLENSDLSKLSAPDLDLLRRALGPFEVRSWMKR